MNTLPEVQENPTTQPLPAEYVFAGEPTPVKLFGFTRAGLPLVAFPDGRLEVVALHRIRLVRREDLP